jgi:hypothetical protein
VVLNPGNRPRPNSGIVHSARGKYLAVLVIERHLSEIGRIFSANFDEAGWSGDVGIICHLDVLVCQVHHSG